MTYPADVCADLNADLYWSVMEDYRKESLCHTCTNDRCLLDDRTAAACVEYQHNQGKPMLPLIAKIYAKRDRLNEQAVALELMAKSTNAMGVAFDRMDYYGPHANQHMRRADEYTEQANKWDAMAYDIDDTEDDEERLYLMAEAAQMLVGFDTASELCDWLESQGGLSDTDADAAAYIYFKETAHDHRSV